MASSNTTATATYEIETSSEPLRLFNAILQWSALGPKAQPDSILNGEVLEGDDGAGNIRLINFSPSSPYRYLKEKLDFVNHENLETKVSVIEGGVLTGTKLDSLTYHIKVMPKTGAGGSVCKLAVEYNQLKVDQEANPGVIKAAVDAASGVIDAADKYLIANPAVLAA